MKEDSHTQIRTCKICGKRTARYICQECGREVCEICLEPHRWICTECYKLLKPEAPAVETVPWSTPLKLFLLGFLLIFIGMTLIITATALSGTSTNFSAIVFIGPIPIVLGAGPNAIWMIILAVAVTIIGVILFLLSRKQT
ncbi:hypothetical protein DRO69_01085 [Candidatus Bathyarchaeota archaeon]|nr:MAG: hypothetical protein DRO69_01085 [Candidatus Bathyarchaeota archaeon]